MSSSSQICCFYRNFSFLKLFTLTIWEKRKTGILFRDRQFFTHKKTNFFPLSFVISVIGKEATISWNDVGNCHEKNNKKTKRKTNIFEPSQLSIPNRQKMKVNKEREGAKINNFNKQLFFWGESRTQHTFVTLLILLNSEFFFLPRAAA